MGFSVHTVFAWAIMGKLHQCMHHFPIAGWPVVFVDAPLWASGWLCFVFGAPLWAPSLLFSSLLFSSLGFGGLAVIGCGNGGLPFVEF